jgi:hypothetical protein
LGRILKEAVMTYFKILYRLLPEEDEGIRGKLFRCGAAESDRNVTDFA